MPPGSAHSPVSLRLIASTCNGGPGAVKGWSRRGVGAVRGEWVPGGVWWVLELRLCSYLDRSRERLPASHNGVGRVVRPPVPEQPATPQARAAARVLWVALGVESDHAAVLE
eukprot:scaffold36698_cov46-Phaeocystis_antarctica.AAC.2